VKVVFLAKLPSFYLSQNTWCFDTDTYGRRQEKKPTFPAWHRCLLKLSRRKQGVSRFFIQAKELEEKSRFFLFNFHFKFLASEIDRATSQKTANSPTSWSPSPTTVRTSLRYIFKTLQVHGQQPRAILQRDQCTGNYLPVERLRNKQTFVKSCSPHQHGVGYEGQ
jgi:hypothetical protein